MDISSVVTNQLRRLNLYVLPQYLWLILLYYLMINSFIILFENIEDFRIFIKNIPEVFLNYNNIVMRYIDMWVPFLIFLGFILILSGVIIKTIQVLPYIENFQITIHGPFGIYLGIWMLIISCTYKSYIILGSWFLLLLPAIYCIAEVIKKLINKKLGQLYR
ncbi:hypothetical protein P9443_19170 [Peribacillus frigoritolerans]|uniref:hypothetical protein n=1 Tax=Peribacillus frigoritolerans TaxID=450367 RepID=UPI002E2092A8|nr:hypothetical protein [Peribacillus frigoritolerans]